MGSENGMPSSIISAPAAAIACMAGSVISGLGSPATMYATSALRSLSLIFVKHCVIRFISDLNSIHLGYCEDILIASAGKIDNNNCVGVHLLSELFCIGDRVA